MSLAFFVIWGSYSGILMTLKQNILDYVKNCKPAKRPTAILVASAILIIAAVCFSVSSVREIRSMGNDGNNGSMAGNRKNYLCPMHPFITADRPLSCSICGMSLVAKGEGAAPTDPACSVHSPGGVALSPQQRIMANVDVVRIASREFAQETTAAGRVAWDERLLTRISARTAGRVERLHVSFVGARISAGQPLLDIYAPELVAAQKEYLLAMAGTETAREDAPADSRAMMEGLRDAARSRLKVWGMSEPQIAELERIRQPRQTVTVNAPVGGIVTERLVTAGQYVNEGTPLFSVGALSTVWIFAELFENDIQRIALGAPALVTTEAFPGKAFHGRVTFIDPAVNPETRTLKVRVDLDNRSGLLKPEMFVKVTLKGRKIRGLAIPEGAVAFSGDRSLVWVENSPGVFVPRSITVGRKGDGYYELLSGLTGNESVAASGGFLIDAESQLRALQPSGQATR